MTLATAGVFYAWKIGGETIEYSKFVDRPDCR
jgi:hypothetical protein